MKTVYLMRHGKAEAQSDPSADHSRKLIQTGVTRTRKAAMWLRRLGIHPSFFLSSSATRCIETMQLTASILDHLPSTMIENAALYHADQNTILRICRMQSDAHTNMLLVAHDPGLCNLINEVASVHMDKFPTSAIAGICFQAKQWKNIAIEKSELVFMHKP